MTDKEKKKFLRQEKIRHVKHKISMLLPKCIFRWSDSFKFFLKPQQKWLIKKIPNTWIDKDALWEICILEGIVHYVEQDGGLGMVDDWKTGYEENQLSPNYPQSQKEFDKEVKEHYELITLQLPLMKFRLEEAWKKIPKFDFKGFTGVNILKDDYDATYENVDKLKKQISDLKTQIMIWAVTNREKIWT